MNAWHIVALLLSFSIVTMVQNMAFTWSSRSRNSGDPSYHRKAALCSNSIFWICNWVLTLEVVQWQHRPFMLGLSAIIYVLSTTEGSVMAMRYLLKKEQGKRLVGAR